MDREPASDKSFIRCPECLRSLPHHTPQCSLYQDARRKLLKVGLGFGAASIAAFLLGKAQAVPAPSVGSIITPGSMEETASYVIYIDGATYLAKNGRTGDNDYSGTDASTVIQAALTAIIAGGMLFFKNGVYLINTPLSVPSNVQLVGEGGNTILKANAIIASILTFTTSISRSTVQFLQLDANSKATNCINWNQTEISAINFIQYVIFSNSLGKAIVLDGNEDTQITNCLIQPNCADGISWNISAGAGQIYGTTTNVPLTGKDLVGTWQLMTITDSVLNTIDCQASNVTRIVGCYLANRTSSIISTNATGPNIIEVIGCYIGIGSSNTFIVLTKLPSGGVIIKDSFCVALDGTNTFLVNIAAVTAQTSVVLENLGRSATTIKPEAVANVAYVFTRNIFSKGANGIFNSSVDETNKFISFYTGTQQNPSTASTAYKVKSGTCKITSTGGTGVSITIVDGNGTTVLSGAATVTREILLPGYTINFGGFSVAPTVTVEWI